jgi:alpha-galactosidase
MLAALQKKRQATAHRWTVAGVFAIAALFASGVHMNALAVKAPCVTPPMGWNSYDCYSYHVTEAQFMANVHYVATYLKQYGWQYCVVDFVWWIPYNGTYGNNQSGNWNFGHIDQYGRFLPDTTRFPSSRGGRGFKPLADSVHNLGLKFGIHVMRGVPRMARRSNYPVYNSTYTCSQAADTTSTCAWLDWMWGTNMGSPAGQAYLNSILSLYYGWDVDFIKVDDLSAPTYHASEVVGYANAIASVSREVAFSTSPGATPLAQASHVMQYANQWRLVNDLWDLNWTDFTNALQVAESWRNTLVNGQIIAGPGHWPDVDMLPFGHLSLDGPNGSPRYSLSTRTKGEHRVLYFLYCISNNPLMWGGNLPDNSNDRFYDSLMMCSDAIYINQRGINGRVLRSYSTNTPVWVSTHPTDTTTKFLMLGNTSGSSQNISVTLNTIGFSATQAVPVRNVWTRASLGNFTGTFSQTIPTHDAGLYVLGNGSTAIAPVARIEKTAQPAAERIIFTTNNRCVIPAAFAGKTIRVSVFSLSGKLLNSVVTRDRSIPLYKNNTARREKVGIVKITVVR